MKEVISVELPDFPKGLEFEDFIAAYFQSVGFFVEKNISIENILQLDISLTDYTNLPNTKLVEIKSGEWEFKDVFKVKGWMVFSNINEGLFIVQKGRQNFDFYRSIADDMGIQLLTVPDLKLTNEYLANPLCDRYADDVDVETFRYVFWMEREYLRLLKAWKNSDKSKKRYRSLEDYYFDINCKSYFSKDLTSKTKCLYESYDQNFHISAKCASEIIGKDFNTDQTTIPESIFKDTFYSCKFNILQISAYLEHQSRLRLLKCAVDFLLYNEEGDKSLGEKKLTVPINLMKFTFLPSSFLSALDKLKDHSHFKLYPIFWQWFLLAFGGFIIMDIKDEEYELLSLKTRVPIAEIDNALCAFDILFPIEGGWFQTNGYSNIKELKISSMPIRGIGANYRRLVYAKKENLKEQTYEDLHIDNPYALKDLKKWNNLGVDVLYKAKPINN